MHEAAMHEGLGPARMMFDVFWHEVPETNLRATHAITVHYQLLVAVDK